MIKVLTSVPGMMALLFIVCAMPYWLEAMDNVSKLISKY